MSTKTKLLIPAGVLVVALTVFALRLRHTDQPGSQGTLEERQIAEACLKLLRSPMTNHVDISPDDPRLPEAIRVLHPVDVTVDARSVVVMFHPRDGLAEYHLAPVSTKRPGRWRLLGAGPKFNNEHRELLQIQSN